MIIPLTEILKFRPRSGDEDLGVLSDLYLGDRHWHIRYFQINASSWRKTDHEALLYIVDLGSINRSEKIMTFRTTREKIACCPSCGVARPVCGSLMSTLHDYYEWPRYWEEEPGLKGPMLSRVPPSKAPGCLPDGGPDMEAPSLYSAKALIQCQVEAENRPIGDLCDLLIDLGEWTVRYLVVRLQDDHKQVVLSPRLINHVDEAGQCARVDFSERMLRNSPCYHRGAPIMMTYDDGVTDYYYFSSKWLLNYNPNQMISYNDYQLLKK